MMEATSAYWKPPFYLLEDDIECQVVNARDVKNVPGRAKMDKLDSVWLAKLAERGMLRASFIPPRPQRQLRDLTRYRRALTEERTRGKAARRETTRRRPDQAVLGDQRHLRRVRGGDICLMELKPGKSEAGRTKRRLSCSRSRLIRKGGLH
jgi:transposase